MKDKEMLPYLQVPLGVLSLSSVINKDTGEVVTLDLYDKIVYCYLNNWYRIGGNSNFTPSIRKIASDTGMKKTKASACVKNLENAGVISISTQGRGKRCYFSKVTPPEDFINLGNTG